MKTNLHRYLADDGGATMIEYSLIGVLVSIAAIVALRAVGLSVEELLYVARDELGRTPGVPLSP